MCPTVAMKFLPPLLGNYDRPTILTTMSDQTTDQPTNKPTNQLTDMRDHRKLHLVATNTKEYSVKVCTSINWNKNGFLLLQLLMISINLM